MIPPAAGPSTPWPLIVGAGPVGLSLALACKRAGLAPLLLAPAHPAGGSHADPRAIALSWGSRLLLEKLDAWSDEGASAITEVLVSERGAFGSLRFTAGDLRVPALGYVLDYPLLARRLEQTASHLPRHRARALRVLPGHGSATVETDDGQTLTAALVVLAEGGGLGHFQPRVHAYGQTAILARLRGHAHRGRAFERFTPSGPVALLPDGDGWALVWTLADPEADAVAALDDNTFLDVLRQRFGGMAGPLLATGPRFSYPLSRKLVQPPVRGRVVAVGNAAQSLHPFAGQGFNLGLRDAWTLAGHLAGDTDAERALHRFEASRQRDRGPGMWFSDRVLELFARPGLGPARGLGLLGAGLLPPLRRGLLSRLVYGGRQP